MHNRAQLSAALQCFAKLLDPTRAISCEDNRFSVLLYESGTVCEFTGAGTSLFWPEPGSCLPFEALMCSLFMCRPLSPVTNREHLAIATKPAGLHRCFGNLSS